MTTHYIPARQTVAFQKKVAERLGLDLATIANIGWEIDSMEKMAKVQITFALPADEVREMFNEAGKA